MPRLQDVRAPLGHVFCIRPPQTGSCLTWNTSKDMSPHHSHKSQGSDMHGSSAMVSGTFHPTEPTGLDINEYYTKCYMLHQRHTILFSSTAIMIISTSDVYQLMRFLPFWTLKGHHSEPTRAPPQASERRGAWLVHTCSLTQEVSQEGHGFGTLQPMLIK